MEAMSIRNRSNSLPTGWTITTLGEVTESAIEQRGPEGIKEFLYIDIGSIDNKTKRIVTPQVLPVAQAPSRARQRLSAKDVLVSMTRPNLNAVAILSDNMSGATGSTGFHVLRSSEVAPDWFYYLVQTNRFIEAMTKLVQGALYPAVRPKDIRAYAIPLAPLPEQRRIVAEIEKQLTRLDAAVEALKRSRANLQRYRASVLKAACEGRLVPNEAELARAESRDYEPTDVLLQRILKERRAKWEAAGLAKMKAKVKAPKDDRWRAKYTAATSPEVDRLPAVPDGWTWASVQQLASLTLNSVTDGPFGSNLKTAHYTESGPRVIRLQNIGDGVFVDEHAHISSQHFASLAKHRVHAGDLVIAALGERPPRACVIPSSVGPAIVKADCVRFKPNDELALPSYLNYALNSDGTRTRTAAIVHGVGRPRLNLGEIKSIALPLPPLDEQHRIVVEVERRLSVIEEIKALVDINLKRAERLRQSILKRAFEGKLVPQDPSDEPASVLLERIRAEQIARGERDASREGGNRMKRERA